MSNPKYIRFDWAAKNILRNKADFVVFEGLISVLVKEKVTIVELLDSESNKESKDDKYNRVDIKAKNSKGEIILVEIQQTRELEGRAEERLENARNLKENGVPVDVIAKSLRLTQEEVSML